MHCELLYTYYRLQVKLASTHLPAPPPCKPSCPVSMLTTSVCAVVSTAKPSMLKSKVKERQLIEETRKKVCHVYKITPYILFGFFVRQWLQRLPLML